MNEAETREAFEKIATPNETADERAFAIFQAGAGWARDIYEPAPAVYRVRPPAEGVKPCKFEKCTFTPT